MKPTVYIFRGAPASGKGTLVPKFCELLSMPVALISQDTLRWGFHLVGRGITDITDSEHMFAYQNTVLMYKQYLKNGKYSIVVEGLFTWNNNLSSQGNVQELIELANQQGIVLKALYLKQISENFCTAMQKEPLLRLQKNLRRCTIISITR